MKPIGILRHSATDGPGHFVTFLEQKRLPWQLIKVDAGEAVPRAANAFSGLCLLGGPMSVNDDLPWIAPVLALISDAVVQDVPIIGHCLGGQLLSKALGGVVTCNPVQKIGWGRVAVLPVPQSREWLGEAGAFESFHWHGETFSVPPGATRVAASAYCANQMFTLGKHLGMQCHIEMTRELITNWCEGWAHEVSALARRTPSVQTPAEMLDGVHAKVERLHRVADGLYNVWIKGLAC